MRQTNSVKAVLNTWQFWLAVVSTLVVLAAVGVLLQREFASPAESQQERRTLPFVTSLLTDAEMAEAKALVLDDATMAGRLAGHRYRVLSGEVIHNDKDFDGQCPTFARDCAELSLFDYTAAQGYLVTVSLASDKVLSLREAGSGALNLSEEEVAEARQIVTSSGQFQDLVSAAEWRIDHVALGHYVPGARVAWVGISVTRDGEEKAGVITVDLVNDKVMEIYPLLPVPPLSAPATAP